MNQLTPDTRKRMRKTLRMSVRTSALHAGTYRVVMLTVKVKLVDKPAKSHAGRVNVVNAASPTRKLGTIFIIEDKA